MTSLLVTGANGFVGQLLCEEALLCGFRVVGVTRGVCKLDGIESVVVGEINGQTDWCGMLGGINVILHLAARVHVMHDTVADPLAAFRAVNTEGTEHLARSAAAAGVKRFVYVSTIKVNGEETADGRMANESDSPSPRDPYGISKCEAEQALHRVAAETGLEVVIVRPPLVYGPGVKGNFVQMLKALSNRVLLPVSSINNQRSLVYVKNLVNALLVCATHPAAAGQTYLVCDAEDISTPELLRRLGEEMGTSARLFAFPSSLLVLVGKMMGKGNQIQRLTGSLQIDSGKIRRELNWTPPYSLLQGLQATVAWYKANCTKEK